MNWLAIAFALELGLLPTNGWRVYEPPAIVIEQPEFYQQLEARVILLDHLFVGGSIRIYDWMVRGAFNFWPSGVGLLTEAGFTFGGLELDFRHWCGVHPVVPYLEQVPRRIAPEGAYEELYLRFSGKLPLWRRR